MKKDKNILDNLKISQPGFKVPDNYFKSLESSLIGKPINKKSGFKVPKNYFENFDVKAKIKVLPKKTTGFKVPNNYFDTIDVNSITKTEKPKKIFNLNPYKILGFSIAASLILFFGLNNINQNSTDSIFSSIDQNDISSWLDEGLINFNFYEIEEVISDTDMDFAIVSSDDIYNYLENTDIESLIIEE